MLTVYKHEMKTNLKSLLIWTFSVAGLCFACILLFSTMEENMGDMAESFSKMGAFSDAFGMNKLSIATLEGFYAAEVGTVHSLGGAMFAAIISSIMLSKEEDGHTSEFLFSMPISRGRVVSAKFLCVISNIFVFNILCIGMYLLGFFILDEGIMINRFFLYHFMQLVMQIEIACVCFGISACMRKNKLGIGLGGVLFFYAFDLMARVIPDLGDFKVVSPFSYANAADIFSTGEISVFATIIGIIMIVLSLVGAYYIYTKKDLAV